MKILSKRLNTKEKEVYDYIMDCFKQFGGEYWIIKKHIFERVISTSIKTIYNSSSRRT